MSSEAFNFSEVSYRLSEEVAIVVFRKKDKSIRTLLCTRCMHILNSMTENGTYMCAKINGRDNILVGNKTDKDGNVTPNRNIAAIDLIIEDVRCFNIDKVIEIKWLGAPQNKEQEGYCMQWFALFKQYYDKYDERTEIENIEVRQQMGI